MRYQDYLKSDDWKQKRTEKRSTNNRCAICADESNLDTHHLNYRNLFDVEQSDLRILCRRCHFLGHELMRNGKVTFKGTSHHSKFASLKSAVKKELGIGSKNMFRKE